MGVAYPHAVAVSQATWLSETLGPGWEPMVYYATVDRGVSTTDSDMWTFGAEKGTVRVHPEQVYKRGKEYVNEDLARLAAEALVYAAAEEALGEGQ